MSTWWRWKKGLNTAEKFDRKFPYAKIAELIEEGRVVEFEDNVDEVFYRGKNKNDREVYKALPEAEIYSTLEVWDGGLLEQLSFELPLYTAELEELDKGEYVDETIKCCKKLKSLIDRAIDEDEAIYKTL